MLPSLAKKTNTITSEPFALVPISTLARLGECSRSEILTFTALAAHADPSGHCWPGRERLSALTGLSPSRISKATSGLEQRGLLRKSCQNGIRVDYYLLTPARNGTPPVPKTAHRTDHVTDQKTERAAKPVSPPTDLSPAQAPLSLVDDLQEPVAPVAPVQRDPLDLRKAKTAPPDSIPPAWLEESATLRPDLNPIQIKASAEVFLDHHRAKGTTLANWLPAWRNWIRRERAAKAPAKPLYASNTDSRYPHTRPPLSPEEQARQVEIEAARTAAADRAHAERIKEYRRVSGMDDPKSSARPTPPNPSRPAIPLRQQRDEIDERERCQRFEENRRAQLEAFERRLMEREKQSH